MRHKSDLRLWFKGKMSAWIKCDFAQFLFNAKELIVFRHTVAS